MRNGQGEALDRALAGAMVGRLARLGQGRSSRIDLDDLLIGLTAERLGCEKTLTLDTRAASSPLFESI